MTLGATVLGQNGDASLQCLKVFNFLLPREEPHMKSSAVCTPSLVNYSLVVNTTVIFQSLTGFLNMPAETVRLLCGKQTGI